MGLYNRVISVIVSACLFQTTTFVAIPSFAKAAETKAVPEERITELYDILRPVRDFETVSEMFYRATPYMSEADRIFLGERFGKIGMERMPTISRQGDAIMVQSKGAPDVKIQLFGPANDPDFYLNGEKVAVDLEATSLMELQTLEKILKKNEKKAGRASFLFSLFVPQAHAFDWMTGGMIALAVGAMAFVVIKQMKDKKKAEKLAKQCSSLIPTCYVLNGTYFVHPNQCGSKEVPGALSVGTSTCPSTTATSSSMNTYATPTPTPVTTTPVTLPASTTPAATTTGTSGQQ